MKRLTSLVFLFLLLTQAISSQDLDTASIKGLVQDQNEAAIPGAVVACTLLKTGAKRTAVADSEGRYRLIQLDPGPYSLQLSASGFASQELKDITVVAGQTIQLTTTLALAEVTESVTVTANEIPPIDTRRTVVGTTINARETQSLPIASRSVLDLIFTSLKII